MRKKDALIEIERLRSIITSERAYYENVVPHEGEVMVSSFAEWRPPILVTLNGVVASVTRKTQDPRSVLSVTIADQDNPLRSGFSLQVSTSDDRVEPGEPVMVIVARR